LGYSHVSGATYIIGHMKQRKIEVNTYVYGACLYAVSTMIDGLLMETVLCTPRDVVMTRNRGAEVWAGWFDSITMSPIPPVPPAVADADFNRPTAPMSIFNLLNLKKELCQ
jgi:hypothetical protein